MDSSKYEQRTPEWENVRLGKVTASRIIDVQAKLKGGGYGATRANYIADIVCERLTGERDEAYINAAMQHGIDNEPLARIAYEAATGNLVEEVGFVPHPSIAMAGASPDGLVGDDGLIEIKCPNKATHLDFLLTRKIPLKYELQMLFQMICTGRKWCDYASYHPAYPESLKLSTLRVHWDQARVDEIEAEVIKFLEEVDQIIKQLEAA